MADMKKKKRGRGKRRKVKPNKSLDDECTLAFFTKENIGSFLREIPFFSLSAENFGRESFALHRSLVLALHLAYEVRISDLDRRSRFQNVLLGKDDPSVWNFLLKFLPGLLARVKTPIAIDFWNAIVEKEQNYWLDAIHTPRNIARVRALRENVYAFIICAMTKTPLIIVGKPGCSKTLSVTKVLSALSGSSGPGLRHLAKIHPFPYQGSRQSTSSSITQVDYDSTVC